MLVNFDDTGKGLIYLIFQLDYVYRLKVLKIQESRRQEKKNQFGLEKILKCSLETENLWEYQLPFACRDII